MDQNMVKFASCTQDYYDNLVLPEESKDGDSIKDNNKEEQETKDS